MKLRRTRSARMFQRTWLVRPLSGWLAGGSPMGTSRPRRARAASPPQGIEPNKLAVRRTQRQLRLAGQIHGFQPMAGGIVKGYGRTIEEKVTCGNEARNGVDR